MTAFPPTQADPDRTARMVGAICLAALALPLTFSGGAIATPDLARSFGYSGPLLSWVVNGFMLVFGALPLAAGALADRIGRRRVFRWGLSGFVLSGAALALAPGLLVVDLLRALQGLCAAATLAGGGAVLAQIADDSRRRRAFSLLGATFGFGLAFGPLAAGLALELGGWRAVFLLASGVASLSLFGGIGAIPESRSVPTTRFDIVGAALFAGVLICLTSWAVLLPGRGPGHPVEIGLLGATGLGLMAFLRSQRRGSSPMIDVSLLDNRAFLAVQALPVATCFCFVTLLVVVPLQLIGAGHDEVSAGAICMALSLPVFVIPVILSRIGHHDPRRLVAAGLGLAGLGLVGLAFVPFDGPVLPLMAVLLVIGCGTGLPWGIMDGLAIEVAPRDKAGVAAGLFSTVRVASEGIVLALVSAGHVQVLAGLAGIGDADALAIVAGGPVPAGLGDAVRTSHRVLFLSLAGLICLSAVFILRRLGRQSPAFGPAPDLAK